MSANDERFNEGVRRLREGGIIAFQTETFFGLGCDPNNFAAVENLLALKDRETAAGVPLIIDKPSRVQLWIGEETQEVRDARLRLELRFWPGPLTMVIATADDVRTRIAPGIFGPEHTLAIRVSSSELSRRLAEQIGGAITATSANPKGAPPARTVFEVENYFPEFPIVAAKSDESDVPGGAEGPSTIVDVRKLPFRVLREGAIPSALLKEWL